MAPAYSRVVDPRDGRGARALSVPLRRAAQAPGGYLRKYVFAPRYGTEERLVLRTDDGLRLTGARLGGPPDAPATVVLAHGLAHWSRTPRIHAFARWLARRVHVVVPDMRGHGTSEGVCTLGREEPRDIAAAVAAAVPGLPVVTVGLSLGAANVLLHAGTYGGVAGTVAISGPAWSGAWDTPSTVRVRRYVTTRAGRQVLAVALRTRVADCCEAVPDSRDVVANIAPAFTVIVHDPADHYFGEEHPRTLYEWAREPKALWLIPGIGHGTDVLTPDFATRLLDDIIHRLADGSPDEADKRANRRPPAQAG